MEYGKLDPATIDALRLSARGKRIFLDAVKRAHALGASHSVLAAAQRTSPAKHTGAVQ